jgi:hypothetical protein
VSILYASASLYRLLYPRRRRAARVRGSPLACGFSVGLTEFETCDPLPPDPGAAFVTVRRVWH